MRPAHVLLLALAGILLTGCNSGLSGSSTPPLPGRATPRIHPAVIKPPVNWSNSPGEARTSSLLSFDSPADVVFATMTAGNCSLANEPSGATHLVLMGDSPAVSVRLSSLLRGRPFPADWSAVGLRFRPDAPVIATLSFLQGEVVLATSEVDTRLAAKSTDAWHLIAVDIPESAKADDSQLRFALKRAGATEAGFDAPLEAAIDDVSLIANGRAIRTPVMSAIRRGTYWTITGPNVLTRVPSELSPTSPMRLVEWARTRMIFQTVGSPGSFVAIDHLGRMIRTTPAGSTYSLVTTGRERMSERSSWRLGVRSPGQVQVPEEQGRVERQAPGDRNQDGYDESRNSYRVRAASTRLDITLVPAGVPLENAVIEIEGLETRTDITATLSGQVIQSIERTSAGSVLIELPGPVERPVILQVRAK